MIRIWFVVALAACGNDMVDDLAKHREVEMRMQEAELRAREAEKAAQEAGERLTKLERDLGDLARKLDATIEALTGAQNDADRTAAKAKLDILRKERADMEARIAQAKAAAAKAQRTRGTTVSKQCQDNPLAKGCD